MSGVLTVLPFIVTLVLWAHWYREGEAHPAWKWAVLGGALIGILLFGGLIVGTRYLLKLKNRLNAILARHTGQPIELVEKATDRDNFMTPEDAKAFGLVDEIIQSRKQIPGLDKPSPAKAA